MYMNYKKINFTNQPYEYKEEKEEKEYKSPLEKHINKKKKPDKNKYRILANPNAKLFIHV
jgi:hypothetical protein